MGRCERMGKCPVVGDDSGLEVGDREMIVETFCTADYSACARYRVLRALGGEFVPADLLPRQVERAEEIIEENRDLL